jgi:hypothetical protein
MASSDILRQMINNAPEQVENIQSSIGQIDLQIDDLDEQIDGVQNGMCVPAQNDLTDYLENTKLAEIESLYGNPSTIPFSVEYGGNYGKINFTTGGITDFTIVDVTGNVEYEYSGINWDGDTTITKLVGDFAYGNDYLTKPLTDGATYGLIPSKENLTFAKGLLQNNSDQIESSITALEDYAS